MAVTKIYGSNENCTFSGIYHCGWRYYGGCGQNSDLAALFRVALLSANYTRE